MTSWRNLLPHFAMGEASTASLPDRDIGADGFYVGVQWFGILIEITFAREDRK